MDLGQMRSQVRAFVDVDEEELGDSLLDPWFLDAYSRIINKGHKVWTWLQAEYTFSTEPGTQWFDLDDPALQAREIRQVWRPDGFKLANVLHDRASTVYGTQTGSPQAFSAWARKLYLWPTPTETQTFKAIGYREPNVWYTGAAGDVPDCPEEFHMLLVFWATGMAAAQQEDLEVAAYHKGHFDEQLDMLWTDDQSPGISQPIIMGSRRAQSFTPKYNIASF